MNCRPLKPIYQPPKPIYHILFSIYFSYSTNYIRKADIRYQDRTFKDTEKTPMNSNIFVKIYICGCLWGYVIGLTFEFGGEFVKKDPFEEYRDIEELLKECNSGFKASTIKADYMKVSLNFDYRYNSGCYRILKRKSCGTPSYNRIRK